MCRQVWEPLVGFFLISGVKGLKHDFHLRAHQLRRILFWLALGEHIPP